MKQNFAVDVRGLSEHVRYAIVETANVRPIVTSDHGWIEFSELFYFDYNTGWMGHSTFQYYLDQGRTDCNDLKQLGFVDGVPLEITQGGHTYRLVK